MASKLVASIPVPDPLIGRKCRVLFYENGSVRLKLEGTPYVLEECFLTGGISPMAILKLAPKDR